MRTITIHPKSVEVLEIIRSLEAMDMIKVLDNNTIQPKFRISERLLGSLTPAVAEQMQMELEQMRKEWERDF